MLLQLIKVEQCQKMLAYLGITKFKCKYYNPNEVGWFKNIELPIAPEANRKHKLLIFNTDGSIDYAGYLAYVDRWTAAKPDIEIKNIGTKPILDMIHTRLAQKTLDKARDLAAKQYLNRQLCIGGLGFLVQ